MKDVRILGSGCSRCKQLEQRLLALKERHGIMMTPGLVIDGEVRSVGTVPNDAQLLQWLKD